MAEISNGTSAMSPAAAVSIGNYKGVMLCNRPFNGVATTLAREARRPAATMNGPSAMDNSKAAFLAGNPGEPLGMNVPILSEPAHAVKRDRKNTALSKHKKWLHDLQKERARLQEALIEDDTRRRQRKDRFAQREAKMREAVRNNTGDDEDDGGDNNAPRKEAISKKPMWALTKETAEEKLESLEDAEADDLIAFANNLDIDQFLDDVELKARVAQIEQQLAQVQSIVDYEEAQEKREQQQLEDGDGAKPPAALTGSNLAQLERAMSKQFGRSHDGGDGEDDDARSVASSVLSECKSIRSVHSVRSVAALTRRVEAKLGQDGSITAPKVVTIDEEQGARMLIKQNPSNLPYIHRNPAI